MVRVFVNINGRDKLAGELAFIHERLVLGLQLLVRQASEDARQAAIRDMLAEKHGIKHPGLPNRSSAPGESPAKQSGDLINSIRDWYSTDGLRVSIGPTVDYAQYLHPERPIMEPGLAVAGPDFIRGVIALIDRVTSDAAH